MNTFITYIQEFYRSIDKWFLVFCAGFVTLLIILNFRWGVETRWLYNLHSRFARFSGFYLLYAIAFFIPFLLLVFTKYKNDLPPRAFWILLVIAPAIFAMKVSFGGLSGWVQGMVEGPWGKYIGIIINLPARLLLVCIPLLLFWWTEKSTTSFWGLTTRNFNWQPYLMMLLIMVPLIAFASTQSQFLQVYPKVKQVAFMQDMLPHSWWTRILYEISYGIDFITIELFFRGFLVFAFVRYVGADAILPMAVFYCSIHFGKPLFECISSFLGGLLLGIVAYRTQTIVGGLVVHLGIAWLMEIGAIAGNFMKKH